ncbi:MAG: tetratricopeptide repeat protein [Cyanobacteria bacterium SZAS LIN-2]|nr:tetratricopeptide repeat protein [Cyanobacteria bacterium SZAS LIN-2]MBS2006081.1 tetratricopeptide repeat protein [Cyanobacteria bacterium SZAS TMP-1]
MTGLLSLFWATLLLAFCPTAIAGDNIPKIQPLPANTGSAIKDPLFVYNKLIELHPDDYCALYRRGKHKADSSPAGAIRDFKQSLHVNPLQTDHYTKKTDKTQRTMRAWAFQDLGFLYCMQGKFEDGIDCFTHAIALRPAHADNFQNRGAAYQKLGKLDLAKKDFAQAAMLRRTNPDDDCLTGPVSLHNLTKADLQRPGTAKGVRSSD